MQQNLKLSRFILLLYISLCATELSVQRACPSALCKNWLSLKNEGEMEEAAAKLVPLLSLRCYSCGEVLYRTRGMTNILMPLERFVERLMANGVYLRIQYCHQTKHLKGRKV